MRNELEQLAEIENYLTNANADKATFEKRLQGDANLQQETQLLKDLFGAIEAEGIHMEIKRAKTNYNLMKALKYLSITTASLIILAASVILYNKFISAENGHVNDMEIRTELPATNELGGTEWTQADSVLPYYVYQLSGNVDEVIETPAGIIISIPKGSFADKNGNIITDGYELEVKEAMNAADIMKAGLSTWTDDGRLLETSGMFYLNARKNGENLDILKNSNITASVPKLQDRNDMLLFDGVRMKSPLGQLEAEMDYAYGSDEIVWKNPRRPIKELTSVSMDSLNFYPPNFEVTLESAGYPNKNKTFKDSVYLSMKCDRYREAAQNFGIVVSEDGDMDTVYWDYQRAAEMMPNRYEYTDTSIASCGINPSKILAFWNKEFNKTILATREFESRMKFIHGTCSEPILNCYTANVNKPLYYCDSLAATKASGDKQAQFYAYYEEKLGRPDDAKKITGALLKVFERKQRELDALYNRTTGEWYRKQREADEKAAKKEGSKVEQDALRESRNFNEEYYQNLKKVYNELDKPMVTRNARDNFNTFSIGTTGWKNVDAYVLEATWNRKSMEYIDPNSGKKATLTYSELNITMGNISDFTISEVYLIPSGKMSFMRMRKEGGQFKESLNSLFQYHVVGVGYKGNDVYIFTQENISAGDLTITLKPSTVGEVKRFVSRNSSQYGTDFMANELQYLDFKKDDLKRNADKLKAMELRNVLWPVVFPCAALPNLGQPISAAPAKGK